MLAKNVRELSGINCELSGILFNVRVVRRQGRRAGASKAGPSRKRVEWMRFFPRLWLSTPEIRDLPFELRAVLLELHAIAAPTRQLPNDPIRLAHRLGINPRPMKRYLTHLQPFYIVIDEFQLELRPLEALEPNDADLPPQI
jgi:hypothetical protein